MDVLNTTGGGINNFAIGFGIIVCVFGIGIVIAAIIGFKSGEDESLAFAFGIAFVVGGIIALIFSSEPIRHEVTLRPGHVIDATKYEIVEQRGKIYVIEEREAGE